MKMIIKLISTLFVLTGSSVISADDIKNFKIGEAEVVYNFQSAETGVSILTLNALITETNNKLRGLKNTDQRRLSKLGQLIYQCKLMFYRPVNSETAIDSNDPILISKNFSLYTGVDLTLAADDRVGIQAQALQTVDNDSLFSPTFGDRDTHKTMWETVGEGSSINLKQINVNFLRDNNIIETSESVDIFVRFPVLQLEKPVSQWSYDFNLKDFKQGIQYIDENCTPAKLIELINRQA